MLASLRRLGLTLLGGALGGLLGFVIGGGVVFGPAVVGDLMRADGGFSIGAAHGWRLARYTGLLFGLPGGLGGAAAALFAFRQGRDRVVGRRPRLADSALVGLAVAALAAPVALGLYVEVILGPAALRGSSGPGVPRLPFGAYAIDAALCGVAGLLAGVVLARFAAWQVRSRPLR